jgi:hypothetical protein
MSEDGSGFTEVGDRSCFVIGPIGDRLASIGSPDRTRFEQALRIFESIIKPACESVGLEPVRADGITRAGEIPDQIFRYLRDSDIVIADVTGGNPNVMYELGLRHTTNGLTIQIGERGRLPFDVQAIRTIQFVHGDMGYIDAREQLEAALTTGLQEGSDAVSATRIWLEGSTPALQSVQEQVAADEADDDEPGFLDLLAEAETAMPQIGQNLEVGIAVLESIGEAMEKATAEAQEADRRGAGMAGRLTAAQRLAENLAGPAAELQQVANTHEAIIGRVDPGVAYLIGQMEENPALLSEAGGFPEAVEGLANAARDMTQGGEGFVQGVEGMVTAARSLRAPGRTLRSAVEKIVAASSPILRWDERLAAMRRGMSSE